jgi:hypothetical protein
MRITAILELMGTSGLQAALRFLRNGLEARASAIGSFSRQPDHGSRP